jgi:putative FmdB family regulatory protein
MPIFEYACNGCGREFEKLVRSSDAPPDCPACHGTQLTKKLSTFSAHAAAGAPGCYTDMPACGTCGHPDGPGACQLN